MSVQILAQYKAGKIRYKMAVYPNKKTKYCY